MSEGERMGIVVRFMAGETRNGPDFRGGCTEEEISNSGDYRSLPPLPLFPTPLAVPHRPALSPGVSDAVVGRDVGSVPEVRSLIGREDVERADGDGEAEAEEDFSDEIEAQGARLIFKKKTKKTS
ncbi:hypothetical protein HOY80DRAFT_1046511 [Tuber brumale]|nr:hypothetical protein HOY80DRAFT_1046511 [Tuber brumale]